LTLPVTAADVDSGPISISASAPLVDVAAGPWLEQQLFVSDISLRGAVLPLQQEGAAEGKGAGGVARRVGFDEQQELFAALSTPSPSGRTTPSPGGSFMLLFALEEQQLFVLDPLA
jgi:hypothetical protein